jgi:hypothetical protein
LYFCNHNTELKKSDLNWRNTLWNHVLVVPEDIRTVFCIGSNTSLFFWIDHNKRHFHSYPPQKFTFLQLENEEGELCLPRCYTIHF